MKNEYQIYSKVGCSACQTALELVKQSGNEYNYLVLDVHYTIMDLYKVAPRTVKTLPVVIKNGEFLGGLKELKTDLGV